MQNHGVSTANGNGAFALDARDALLDRLNDPKTVDALNSPLDNVELIAFSVSAMDGFLRRSEDVMDAVTDGLHELRDIAPSLDNDIVDPKEIIPRLTELAKVGIQISDLMDSKQFKALMQSGILSPETLTIVGEAGNALVESKQETATQATPRIGLFGLLRLLNDDDVQKSLNFLITFSKKFGRRLGNA